MYNDKRDREAEGLTVGRNPVIELLRSGRPVDSVLIAKGSEGLPVKKIRELCREGGVTVKEVNSAKLDGMCGGLNHQGIAAIAAAHAYAQLGDILKAAQLRGEPPFILIADCIDDPHNLGAMIRTAEAAGMHGVIIPKHGAVGLTAAVARASCGAVEYMPVARVTNLAAAIDELKENGVWIYGAETGGRPYDEVDYSGAAALVVGSEGAGISRLVKDKCDFIVSIPMRGQINSLNASVAAGILAYRAARGRGGAQPGKELEP